MFVLSRLNVDKSPRRQSEGDYGMRQPMKRVSDSLTSFQKCLIGVQCQLARMEVSGQFCMQCEPISDVNPILNIFAHCSEFCGVSYIV